ncbi:MAG: hypothetical protein KJZ86_00035 [Caldilineaceae bacterium]|nr:hypothetical protein [Caldilineaceae bacterium]
MRSLLTAKAILLALFALLLLGASFSAVSAVDGPTGQGTIPPRVDLAVQSLVLSPSNFQAGQPVTVTTTVVNAGDVSVAGRRVYLYIDPADSPPVSSTPATKEFVVAVEWPAGDAMTVQYAEFTFTEAGCGHTIYAWVDPLNRIAEVDESNNLAKIEFCVGESLSWPDAEPDQFEPDDRCQEAKEISVDAPAQARTFWPEDDLDWTKVWLEAGHTYRLTSESALASILPSLSLTRDCNIEPPISFCMPPPVLTVTPPQSGWHYIRAINGGSLPDEPDDRIYRLSVQIADSFGGDGFALFLPRITSSISSERWRPADMSCARNVQFGDKIP